MEMEWSGYESDGDGIKDTENTLAAVTMNDDCM